MILLMEIQSIYVQMNTSTPHGEDIAILIRREKNSTIALVYPVPKCATRSPNLYEPPRSRIDRFDALL